MTLGFRNCSFGLWPYGLPMMGLSVVSARNVRAVFLFSLMFFGDIPREPDAGGIMEHKSHNTFSQFYCQDEYIGMKVSTTSNWWRHLSVFNGCCQSCRVQLNVLPSAFCWCVQSSLADDTCIHVYIVSLNGKQQISPDLADLIAVGEV